MMEPNQGSPPPTPRLAATLVLVRSSSAGPEVLITIRQKNLRFMPGAAVFPGGAVDRGDLDPRWEELCDMRATRAASLIGSDDKPRALGQFVAAIRETYEEVGLLLARGGRVDRATARDADAFLDACLRAQLHLEVERLTPAGRWVTPLGAPIRFDAQFFVAPVSTEVVVDPDPSEVAECRWLSPAAVLAGLAAGEYLMAPPTIEMLHRLDGHPTAEAVVDSVSGPEPRPADIISTRLSPNVHVVIAPNPGLMTGPGTNTYVVGSGPTCVIDPAVDDEAYLNTVRDAAGEIATIVVTHRHPDHIGGLRALKESSGATVRAWGSAAIDGVDVDPITDGESIEVPGARLSAVFAPGHASDHICLYAQGIASLFAGDNILGEGTAVIAPPDGNMRDYLRSLRRLLSLKIDRIYPGHFRALDGGHAVVERYLAHRADRERSILRALEGGSLSIDDLVTAVYVDTPAALHAVARFSVLAHLEMLNEDGRVSANGDFWSLADV